MIAHGSSLIVRIALAFSVLLFSFNAFSGPYISTNWKSTTMDKAACLDRGEVVLSELGYSPTTTLYSVLAENSEITLMVRCDIPNFVFFISSRYGKIGAEHNFIEINELNSKF